MMLRVSGNDDLSPTSALIHSCVIFDSVLIGLRAPMYNRAKFYAALAVYLLPDFPFLLTNPVRARDLLENVLRILTAEKYRCT